MGHPTYILFYNVRDDGALRLGDDRQMSGRFSIHPGPVLKQRNTGWHDEIPVKETELLSQRFPNISP
jgi:hypothetical protein